MSRLPRRGRERSSELGPDERRAMLAATRRRCASVERDRRGHRADDPREPARRGAGLPAPARGDGAARRWTRAPQPCGERCAATATPTPIASDGGATHPRDGRDRDRARPRVPRHHRPLAAPDGRQRPQHRAAAWPSSTRSRRSMRSSRRSASSPGSRSTSTRTARSTRSPRSSARLDVVVGSVHSALRCRSAPMTRADGDRARRPEPRHPRPLHRADEDGASATGRPRPSTPRSSSPPRRASTRRSRSTRDPSASTRRSGSCASRSRPAAASRSTRMPTRPASSSWLRNGCERAFLCGVTPDDGRQRARGR